MMLRQLGDVGHLEHLTSLDSLCKLSQVMRPFPAVVLPQVREEVCFRMFFWMASRTASICNLGSKIGSVWLFSCLVVDVCGMSGMSCKDYVQKNPHVGAKDGNHEPC